MNRLLSFTMLSALCAVGLVGPVRAGEHDFYAGVGLGYSASEIDFDLNDVAIGDGEPKGFDYGLLAGYRHHFDNRFFAGVEAGFDWSSADDMALLGGASYEVEKNHSYQIAIKPGYQLTEQLGLFGTLGYKWSQYELNGPLVSDDDTLSGYIYHQAGYSTQPKIALAVASKQVTHSVT